MSTESKKCKEEYDLCNICCGKSRVKLWVKCPYCNFSCCRTCLKTYLLETKNMTPKCIEPSCDKELSFEFIAINTDNDFYNNIYRNHRANILLELEKSLLPGTQHLAQEAIRRTKVNKEISCLELQNKELKKQIELNKRKIDELRYGPVLEDVKENKEEKNIIHCRCPSDECKGFVGNGYRCGVCTKKVCSKCFLLKIKNEDHKCKEDDIETVKVLKKNTKACPGCSSFIYKIDGCDQMFCTNCHVVFSWDTLIIQKNGVIHNPHFYQYQKQNNNGIAPRDNRVERCGGIVTISELHRKIDIINLSELTEIGLIFQTYRLIRHIRAIVIPRYPNRVGLQDNTDLRVDYLCNVIDEKKWISLLKAREKKREKNYSINLILSMFVDTCQDIINNIVDDKTPTKSDEIIIKSLIQLCNVRDYSNEELSKIESRLKNRTPRISDDMKELIGVS